MQNIQRTFLAIVITFCVMVVFLLFFFFGGNKESAEKFASLPDASVIADNPTVPVQKPTIRINDSSLMVNNFLENGETIADPVNAEHFILAGPSDYCLPNGQCLAASVTESFAISYNQRDSVFMISLLEEPLRDSRQAAEAFIVSRLGITKEQACALRYTIMAPMYVNQFYAGIDLKFSFCPGSVSLD